MQANTTAKLEKDELQFTLSKFTHEIRNPIALISSELQMLASSHPEISDDKHWHDIIDDLEYVKELLDDLSDFNNAGRISSTVVDLKEYLDTILTSVRPTLHYLGITLETNIPEILHPVPVDRIKMRQALLNLLRNSQESISGSSGKIVIQAEELQDSVCISISDNGCGIRPERLEDIFSPFVTSKSEGTGLGLAVTRQIIEAHGGRIEAFSTPGHGSVFRIFLGW